MVTVVCMTMMMISPQLVMVVMVCMSFVRPLR